MKEQLRRPAFPRNKLEITAERKGRRGLDLRDLQVEERKSFMIRWYRIGRPSPLIKATLGITGLSPAVHTTGRLGALDVTIASWGRKSVLRAGLCPPSGTRARFVNVVDVNPYPRGVGNLRRAILSTRPGWTHR